MSGRETILYQSVTLQVLYPSLTRVAPFGKKRPSRDTGQSRGFGFVEMLDSTAAKAAMQGLQGKELAGRTLTVNEAKPREPRGEPRRACW